MYYWLRDKTDKEKLEWLEKLSHTPNLRTPCCCQCGAIVGYADRKTINVGIYDQKYGQKVKKLCTLCNKCYEGLLLYLGVPDVDFNLESKGE